MCTYNTNLSLSVSLCLSLYIYTYIYIHTYNIYIHIIYTYIYIYTHIYKHTLHTFTNIYTDIYTYRHTWLTWLCIFFFECRKHHSKRKWPCRIWDCIQQYKLGTNSLIFDLLLFHNTQLFICKFNFPFLTHSAFTPLLFPHLPTSPTLLPSF